MDENARIHASTAPFEAAGLVQCVEETGALSESWETPDGRWGIQPRYATFVNDDWMVLIGWDVFSTRWVDGVKYVEAIYEKGAESPAEAVEALHWVIEHVENRRGWDD